MNLEQLQEQVRAKCEQLKRSQPPRLHIQQREITAW